MAQFVDPADGITKTMIIDSWQMAKNGSTALDPNAAGGKLQLSDESLRVVMQNAGATPAMQAIDLVLDSGTLIRAVAYVDKATGELKIVRLDMSVKELK